MAWRKAKAFPCIICGRDFNKESKLKKHVKDSHAIEYSEYVKRMEAANALTGKN